MIKVCILDSKYSGNSDPILNWNPDLDPNKFRTGKGHALYQLANVLHTHGVYISFDNLESFNFDSILQNTIYIYYAKDRFKLTQQFKFLLKILFSKKYINVIAVISDASSDDKKSFFYASHRIVPNSHNVIYGGDIFIPHFIQFGIKEYDNKSHSIGTIITRGNLPSEYKSDNFKSELFRLRGEEIIIKYTDVDDISDYSLFRYFLCARNDLDKSTNKPPTKILNALNARCIPIIFDNDTNSMSFLDYSKSIIVVNYSNDPTLLARNISQAIDNSRIINDYSDLKFEHTKAGIIESYLTFIHNINVSNHSITKILFQKVAAVYYFMNLLLIKFKSFLRLME